VESKEKSPQVVFVQKEKRKMNIPEELKKIDQWVCWQKRPSADNKTIKKIPINPATGQPAKANVPDTWTNYETAAAAANAYDGLGFEFLEGGNIFGIDLDHVIENGVINPVALEIIDTMDSYTEISPSGNGVHIIAKGTIPSKDRRKDFIEMYSDGRYFTVTGNVYNGHNKLNERTAEAAAIHAKYLSRQDTATAPQNATMPISDKEVLQKAMNSKASTRFNRLWNGDISLYNNDHSAADLALINDLGYWTNYNAAQMDRLFRQSGLYRDKWDEVHGQETYGQMTINRALQTAGKRTYAQTPPPAEKVTVTFSEDTATTPPPVDSEPEPDQLPDREYYISTQSAAGSMDAFESMLTSVANTPGITTGFSKLDKLLDGGLYPGLVILGAVTSVGKTTVGMQLMDQIAKDGQRDVMIFSLEMSKYELMARSISRESFLNDRNNPLTVRDVLDGRRFAQFSEGKLANFLEAKGQYKIYAKRIFIYEGLGNINVFFIRRMIENHTKITGLPPVVLIDYIQLLAPKDVRMTDKQAVDYNVMALKQISRDFSIPVIGISSLNRASYSKNNQNGGQNGAGKVALESFKESGAIEYSSDILIGLNRNSDDNTGKAMMELDILKNRNGIKDIAADFEYYYKYNYFREI